MNEGINVIQLPLRNYNSAAREAANSADITAHMPADRKYDYRIVYALTPELDTIHRKELEDLASLRSISATGGTLGQDEKQVLLAAIENLLLDNDRGQAVLDLHSSAAYATWALAWTVRRWREILPTCLPIKGA